MPEIVVAVKMKDLMSTQWRTAAKTVKSTTQKMRTALGRVRDAIFSVKGAIVGIGALFAAKMVVGGIYDLAKSFIRTAADAENMKVALTATLGTVKEANLLFKDLAVLGSQVANSLSEMQSASVSFAGVMQGGREEIMLWMKFTTDLAAITKGMGIDFQTTASQVLKMYTAGVGAADVFREKGVLSILGFQKGAEYSIEEVRQTMMKAWVAPESKFREAAAKMATTWDGLMSMFGDAWEEFKRDLMDLGVFDSLKILATTALAGVKSILRKALAEIKAGLEGKDIRLVMIDISLVVLQTVDSMVQSFVKLKGAAGAVVDTILYLKDMVTALHATWILVSEGRAEAVQWMMNEALGKDATFLDAQLGKVSESLKKMKKELELQAEVTRAQSYIENYLKKLIEFETKQKAGMIEMWAFSDSVYKGMLKNARFLSKHMGAEEYEKWRQSIVKTATAAAQAMVQRKKGLGEEKKGIEDNRTAIDGYLEKLKEQIKVQKDLNEKNKKGQETNKEKEKTIKDIGKALEKEKTVWEQIQPLVVQLGDVLIDSVMSALDMIGQKQRNWRKLLRDTLKDLAMTAIRTTLKLALSAAIGAEEGGVFPGGLGNRTPIKRYAAGGITNGPELAVIGEGSVDEAVIPLKRGKVPVDLMGGGQGNTIVFNVNAVDAKGVSQMLVENAETIKSMLFQFGEENPNVALAFSGGF